MDEYCSIFTVKWFLEDVLPQFVGVLGALIVFYLSTNWDRRKEKNAKQEKDKNQAIYLVAVLNSAIIKTNDQLVYINDYLAKNKKNNIDFHAFTLIPLTDIERVLNILKDEKYFHSYVRLESEQHEKEHIESFNTFFSEIGFIYAQFSSIEKMMSLAEQNDIQRKERFKEITDKIISLIGDALMGGEKIKADLWRKIVGLYYEYMERQVANPEQTELESFAYCVNQFLKPVNDELISDFQRDPSNIQTKDRVMAELSRDCIQLYEVIQRGNNLLAEEFNRIYRSVQDSVENLEKLLKPAS